MASTVSAKIIRQLCTAQEAALVRASRERSVKDVSLAALREQRDRARDLRDKFRGLAERQRREARGKQSPRGATAASRNDRTVLKQEIFAEALANFEARIAAVAARGGGAGDSRRAAPASRGRETAKRRKRQAVRKGLRAESAYDEVDVRRKTGRGVVKPSGAATPIRTAGSRGTKSAPAGTKSAGRTARPKAGAAKSTKSSARASQPSGLVTTKAAVRSLPAWSEGTRHPGTAFDPVTERRNTSFAQSSGTAKLRLAKSIERTGAVKHLAHVAARNRRNQAKRDAANAR